MNASLLGRRRRKQWSVLAVAGLVALTALARADSVDDYVKSEMKRLDIPEVAFAIVKNGEVVKSEALGYADLATHREAKLEDRFEIASLTKQFTALAVMILVESARLGLDDPISKYLPDAPPSWSAVTVRHLLNQDSGLPEYATVKGVGLLDKFTREKFMAEVGKLPVDFKPGEAWAYSNTNYALLGWIIEKVANEPYPKFIQENIIGPLGMTHTEFGGDGPPPYGMAKGYALRRWGVAPSPPDADSIKADSALISNVPDMLKWDEALSGLRLISRNSYTQLWSRVKLNSGRQHPYGMGWYLSMPGSVAYIGHGGNSAGFSAGFSHFPRRRLTVILMANASPVDGESMTKQIAAIYDPTLMGVSFQAAPDPDPKRTERIKLVIAALAANRPDEDLMEPEQAIPMRTARGKRLGPGLWGAVRTLDSISFGGEKPQGADKVLTYGLKSGSRSFIAVLLWSSANKLAQASLYVDNPNPTVEKKSGDSLSRRR